MTVEALCKLLGCTVAAGGSGMKREVTGCYCGDLLSRVMTGAPEGSAWITIMGNVNAVAVALMTGVACILLAEDVKPAPEAVEKALQKKVVILRCNRTAYELAAEIHGVLSHDRP